MNMRDAVMTALRFAWRDLRVVFSQYKVLVLSVAIGVAAVTGVGALTDSFLNGLTRDGRTLVGGDISLSRAQEPLTPDERQFLAARGTISVIGSTRAMVSVEGGEAALGDIKAVETSFPLAGRLLTSPEVSPAELGTTAQADFGALVDPSLLARLGLKVGDRVRIGTARFAVRAAIDEEPDRLVSGAAFAPRVIVSREGLVATGLVTPEALIRWTTKLALPAGAADAQVAATVADFKQAFPRSGFEIRTRTNASPQIERIVERISKFLVAMGLLAVVVGGIGVWNAVSMFAERQRVPVAIFKTLGASGNFVFGIALAEILGLALAGVAMGVVLGSALPFAMAPLVGDASFESFQPVLSLRAILGGAAVGFGAALVFAILPAGSVHDVPGALLLRDARSSSTAMPRWRYRLWTAVALLLFIAAVAAVTGDWRFAAAVVGGGLVLAGFFVGMAKLLAIGVRALPAPRNAVGALAWNNLSRTGRMTRAVLVSLGVGLVVLAATSAVTSSLRAQLTGGLPAATPNLFLVGLPSRDDADFRAFLTAKLPTATVEAAPLMRGRIVEVGGVPAEQVAAKESAAWVLEGDRGVTFARTAPKDSTLVAGSWWPADYDGAPLVSIGADAARGLGLHLGDEIAVNVAGRRIAARIANLREINWASFGINFVLVFSPQPIAGAPHTMLYTVAAPGLDDATRNAAFVRDLSGGWPSVVAVDVHAMLSQARNLVDKVGFAVQASSLFTMIAAAVVLAGAVAADSRARARTATILKVIGGTRGQLVLSALLEFVALGLVAGLSAILLGSGVAWAILHYSIDTPLVLEAGSLVALLAGAVASAAGFGLIGNWRVLNERPGIVLRRL